MPITYTPIKQYDGREFIVRDNGDETTSWIPTDLGNSDYRQYLETLEVTKAK